MTIKTKHSYLKRVISARDHERNGSLNAGLTKLIRLAELYKEAKDKPCTCTDDEKCGWCRMNELVRDLDEETSPDW